MRDALLEDFHAAGIFTEEEREQNSKRKLFAGGVIVVPRGMEITQADLDEMMKPGAVIPIPYAHWRL